MRVIVAKLDLTIHLSDARSVIYKIHLCMVVVLVYTLLEYHGSPNPIVLWLLAGIGPKSIFIYLILFSLLRASAGRIGWLVTRTIVAWIDPVALQGRDLEVHAPKLNDVTHAHHLALIVREEVFENLVD